MKRDKWLKRHGFTNGLWRLEERDRARKAQLEKVRSYPIVEPDMIPSAHDPSVRVPNYAKPGVKEQIAEETNACLDRQGNYWKGKPHE